MSNRLTNEVKQNITHALIEHKFAPIRKEIGEESSVIADLAYSLIVSDATAKLLTKLAPGWVPKYAGLYLSYEGKTNFYKFSVDPTTAREERRRFIPYDIEEIKVAVAVHTSKTICDSPQVASPPEQPILCMSNERRLPKR